MNVLNGSDGSARRIRILVVGNAGAGKSSLVYRLCNEGKTTSNLGCTVGCNAAVFLYKGHPSGQPCWIEFWDIGGHRHYAASRHVFYKDVNGVMLCFDVTNRRSYENLAEWIKELVQSDQMHALEERKISFRSFATPPRFPPALIPSGASSLSVDSMSHTQAPAPSLGYAGSTHHNRYADIDAVSTTSSSHLPPPPPPPPSSIHQTPDRPSNSPSVVIHSVEGDAKFTTMPPPDSPAAEFKAVQPSPRSRFLSDAYIIGRSTSHQSSQGRVWSDSTLHEVPVVAVGLKVDALEEGIYHPRSGSISSPPPPPPMPSVDDPYSGSKTFRFSSSVGADMTAGVCAESRTPLLASTHNSTNTTVHRHLRATSHNNTAEMHTHTRATTDAPWDRAIPMDDANSDHPLSDSEHEGSNSTFGAAVRWIGDRFMRMVSRRSPASVRMSLRSNAKKKHKRAVVRTFDTARDFGIVSVYCSAVDDDMAETGKRFDWCSWSHASRQFHLFFNAVIDRKYGAMGSDSVSVQGTGSGDGGDGGPGAGGSDVNTVPRFGPSHNLYGAPQPSANVTARPRFHTHPDAVENMHAASFGNQGYSLNSEPAPAQTHTHTQPVSDSYSYPELTLLPPVDPYNRNNSSARSTHHEPTVGYNNNNVGVGGDSNRSYHSHLDRVFPSTSQAGRHYNPHARHRGWDANPPVTQTLHNTRTALNANDGSRSIDDGHRHRNVGELGYRYNSEQPPPHPPAVPGEPTSPKELISDGSFRNASGGSGAGAGAGGAGAGGAGDRGSVVTAGGSTGAGEGSAPGRVTEHSHSSHETRPHPHSRTHVHPQTHSHGVREHIHHSKDFSQQLKPILQNAMELSGDVPVVQSAAFLPPGCNITMPDSAVQDDMASYRSHGNARSYPSNSSTTLSHGTTHPRNPEERHDDGWRSESERNGCHGDRYAHALQTEFESKFNTSSSARAMRALLSGDSTDEQM